ncbi:response regulator transcription factor [Pseudorhodobacter aquimaris]|uniref:hypothetical protein n=1 Tax=Pseudorhodobacter aquimaris TaxID=687412 RepID=UPI00067E47F2|nr:hypothetical protein [Pseudorhodobacter aquimaris]
MTNPDTIDERKGNVVLSDGTTVYLTPTLLRIVLGPASYPGWTKSPDGIVLMIHREAWAIDRRGVQAHIKCIRKLIGYDMIATHYRMGHSWTEDVPTAVIGRGDWVTAMRPWFLL